VLERARFRGALLGVLIGDVLGAPFEGHLGLVSSSIRTGTFPGRCQFDTTDPSRRT